MGKRIHFVGVGGISMSALAKLSIKLGARVSGSDIANGGWFLELTDLGAQVYHGSNPTVAASAELVVYSSAIADDDAELTAARQAGVPLTTRSAFLGDISTAFGETIAIAGTHGKTTCTALVAHVFELAKAEFCAHVGGVPVGGSNLVYCGNRHFITEACEYKRAFCELSPNIAAILNLESDHPDCYHNEVELVDAFQCFVDKIRAGGTLVLNGDPALPRLNKPTNVHTVTFGYDEECTCRATNVISVGEQYVFDLSFEHQFIGRISSPLFGKHNVSNVLAAVAVCICAGVDPKTVIDGVSSFAGVTRRFERRFLDSGAEIIFDYAHHPSELAAAIRTCQNRTSGILRVYFQPHTYSRTSAYFEEFCDALEDVPYLGLVKTFPAREKPEAGLSAIDLYSALSSRRAVTYFDEILGVARHILRTAKYGDCALILGAGDIYDVGKLLF